MVCLHPSFLLLASITLDTTEMTMQGFYTADRRMYLTNYTNGMMCYRNASMVREQFFYQDNSLLVGSLPLEIPSLHSEAGTTVTKITMCQNWSEP